MSQRGRSGLRRLLFTLAFSALALVPMLLAGAAGGDANQFSSPARSLTRLGLQFNGSPTCSSEKCHGAEKATERPDLWGNEFTLWHGRKDPHHTAYRMLLSPRSKEISGKVKIAAANKSIRCLECHSTYAVGPSGQELEGKEYSAAEGVSCDSCHGPSQKWFDPHAQVGWIKQQRGMTIHADLLRTTGLYDTQPLLARARRCVECHLTTDADLVAAGHPQPTFEMYHFSAIYPERHWRDAGGTFAARVWANGQAAELPAVMSRLTQEAAAKPAASSDELKRSCDRALAHYSVFAALFSGGAASSADFPALEADVKRLGEGDASVIAEAGKAAADDAEKIAPALIKFNPDKATAGKLLSAIAAADFAGQFGVEGQEQQAYAIEAMAQASGADAAAGAVVAILPKKPGEPIAPAEFAKGLAVVREKLAK